MRRHSPYSGGTSNLPGSLYLVFRLEDKANPQLRGRTRSGMQEGTP